MSTSTLTLRATCSAVHLSGVAVTDRDPALLRLLPGATAIDRIGTDTFVRLHPLRAAACEPGTATEATVELETGTRSVRLGDVLYGAARFVHSEHLARHGLVSADAGAFFVGPDGDELVVTIGTGKSTLAVRAAHLGLTVAADDVVLLEVADGVLRATGECGGRVQGRSGAAASLGTPLIRTGQVVRTIVVQPSFGGIVTSDRPSDIDLSSWWWQALSGRVLNTRAFPAPFRAPYLGEPSSACTEAMSTVHRALLAIPAQRLLGDVDGRDRTDLVGEAP